MVEAEARVAAAVEEAAAAKEALYTVAEAREGVAARAAAAAAEAAAVKEAKAAAVREREASDAMNFAVVQAMVHRVVMAAALKVVETAGATSPRPCSHPHLHPTPRRLLALTSALVLSLTLILLRCREGGGI